MERTTERLPLQYSGKKMLCFGAVIGAVIGIIALAPIWLRHNGQYMEYGDYFLQYVPFVRELKRMAASGSLSWSWNSFLGDNFIGAYSYYTVFNPFAWLVALFPDQYILYGTLFATILKLSISMVAAMLYIQRFCQKQIYALVGALLYTFSGFTLVNANFYFFLDVIAVFPFLMYGLEKLIVEKKRAVYVLSLALNAAINYYFFVSTVFIVVIYVIFRLKLYRISFWKAQWKDFLYIAVYSVIGTVLAGIALIPSLYAILNSGKAMENIGTELAIMYWPQAILERLRTLVAPIESGRYHAFYDGSAWSSNGIYLPVFGVAAVLQWCITKRDWLQKVCIFLTICYFIPILNAAFNLFSSAAYTRWLYGPALLFSLATVLTLEEIEEGKGRFNRKLMASVTIFSAGLLLMPTVIYFLYRSGIPIINRFASACTTEYFMGYSAIAFMLILTAANYAGLWYIIAAKSIKVEKIALIVIAACTVNFFVYNSLNYDLHATEYSNEYYYQKAMVEGIENTDESFEYRIDHPGQIANYGLFKNFSSVNYYNSLQNPGGSRFAEAVGIGENLQDTILTSPISGSEYTDALLSVKYYYDYDGYSKIPQGFRYFGTKNNLDIYENENYIPMGFLYNTYCLERQLTDMLPEERAKTMLHTLVIQEADKEIANKYLTLCTEIDTSEDLTSLASSRAETTCSYFSGTSRGFDAEIELESSNIVFFSIPNDAGWEITVNGEPAETLEVNYGLLGVCCGEGSNVISGTYHTPGWIPGIMCSIAFAVIWLAFELIQKVFYERRPKEERP